MSVHIHNVQINGETVILFEVSALLSTVFCINVLVMGISW